MTYKAAGRDDECFGDERDESASRKAVAGLILECIDHMISKVEGKDALSDVETLLREARREAIDVITGKCDDRAIEHRTVANRLH